MPEARRGSVGVPELAGPARGKPGLWALAGTLAEMIHEDRIARRGL